MSISYGKRAFGIMDPSVVRGIGSQHDVLVFFDAIRLVSDRPESEYPFLWALRSRPIVGEDMLSLFEESKALLRRMRSTVVTHDLLLSLSLASEASKLKTDAKNLAGVFQKMFKTLAEDAPEYVRLSEKYPDMKVLESGSIRLGPVEPLVASRLFQQLPVSEFDVGEPPLWLRPEIFDEKFYAGRIQ